MQKKVSLYSHDILPPYTHTHSTCKKKGQHQNEKPTGAMKTVQLEECSFDAAFNSILGKPNVVVSTLPF